MSRHDTEAVTPQGQVCRWLEPPSPDENSPIIRNDRVTRAKASPSDLRTSEATAIAQVFMHEAGVSRTINMCYMDGLSRHMWQRRSSLTLLGLRFDDALTFASKASPIAGKLENRRQATGGNTPWQHLQCSLLVCLEIQKQAWTWIDLQTGRMATPTTNACLNGCLHARGPSDP